MSAAAVRGVVRRLGPTPEPPPDSELVTAFAARRDPAAFAELVRRHGPTVLGACLRVLGNRADAEDAFQAVFLVFSRKAGSIRPAGAVGGWLYGVAVRTANKARVAAARRRRREMIAALRANPDRQGGGGMEDAELRSVLDAELAKLPEPLRAAVVLCDLHGKTRAEAAAELGCPEGTVAARLHRARKRLGDALTRRGLALPAAGIAVLEAAPVSAALAQSAFACVTGGAPVAVQALAREVLRSMTTTAHLFAAGVLAVVAGGLLAANAMRPGEPAPQDPVAAVPVANAPVPADDRPAPGAAWREARVLEQTGWLAGSVAYSPDGRVLFVGGTEGHVRSHTAETGKQLWDHKGDGKLAALSLAPDGKTLAVTVRDGVQFLDAATGKTGDVLEEKDSRPLAVGFYPDRVGGADGVPPTKTVIFGDARGYFVKSWREWPKVSTINLSTVAVGQKPADEYAVPLAVAPTGRWVVTTGPVDPATGKNVLWAWAAGSGEGNSLLEGHKAVVTSAAWSKDNRTIVTGDADGVVILWDVATFKEKSRVNLAGRVAAVAVSADNEFREPEGKVLRRPEPTVVEINLGAKAGVKPGMTFTVLPSDIPDKGRQSRMRTIRVPDEGGKFKTVERFTEKATIEVTEVLGPNLSRCKITTEFDPIRDGAIAGDLLYTTGGRRGVVPHIAAAVASPMPAPNRNADYSEEVFVWPADSPPKQPKPISRHDAGGPFAGVAGLAFSPDGRSLASCFCNFTHLLRGGRLAGKVRVFAVAAEAEKPKPEAPAARKWTERAVLTQHAGPVDSVAFAPDGKSFVSGGADGRVMIWNAETLKPQELGTVVPAGKFTAVAYSKDGNLVAATRDKVMGFFDPAKRQVVLMKPPVPGGRGVAFSPDGKWVAYSDGYTTGFRDLTSDSGAGGSQPGTLEGQLAAPVAWSPDSLYLAHLLPSGHPNGDWRVGIMGVTPDTKPQNLEGHKGKVTAVAWSKDGKVLASGGSDGTVIFRDGKPPFKELRGAKFVGRDGGGTLFHALAFSPDGKTLAAAVTLGSGKSADRVILIDTATAEWSDNLFPPVAPVRSVAFSPDGKTLVGACGIDRARLRPLMTPDEMKAAGAVVVWEREAPAKTDPPARANPPARQQWADVATLTDHKSLVNGVAVAPNGKSFAAATEGNVTCWDSETRKALWKTEFDGAFALVFSRDGKTIFAAGKSDVVRLNAGTGNKAALFGDATGVGVENAKRAIKDVHARALALSADGKRLAGTDGYATWMIEPDNLENYGTYGTRPEDAKPAPAGVAWSADGKRLATIHPKHTERTFPSGLRPDTHWPVRLWSVSAADPVRGLFGHDERVTAVAWSKDGKVIASGDEGGGVILWDAESGKELWRKTFKRVDDTAGSIHALAISETDTTVAASVSLGGSVKPVERVVLLSAKDGETVGQLQGAWKVPVGSVAWFPDGRSILTGGNAYGTDDGGVRSDVIVWERKP